MPWAIKWRSENRLDGKQEYLIGRFCRRGEVPDFLTGYDRMVFRTREQARRYIHDGYGYIAKRKDLRAEPHGWKMPIAVKVKVTVSEVCSWTRF